MPLAVALGRQCCERDPTRDGLSRRRTTEHWRVKALVSGTRRADFHSLRNSCVSMLASSGVHPKTAQMLARHSTIILTMDRNSHLRLADLNQAVQGSPSLLAAPESDAVIHFAGTQPPIPCCPPCCLEVDFSCNALTTIDDLSVLTIALPTSSKSHETQDMTTIEEECDRLTEVRPGGLEPPTDGLEIRCSIRLSYGRI